MDVWVAMWVPHKDFYPPFKSSERGSLTLVPHQSVTADGVKKQREACNQRRAVAPGMTSSHCSMIHARIFKLCSLITLVVDTV